MLIQLIFDENEFENFQNLIERTAPLLMAH